LFQRLRFRNLLFIRSRTENPRPLFELREIKGMNHPFKRIRPDTGKPDSSPSEFCSSKQSQDNRADVETARRFAAARSGSQEFMGELFENCRNYLLLVANASLGEGLRARVAASDLVQETFLEAGAVFERFNGDSEEELLRWLTRILENKLGNAVKRHLESAKRAVCREVRLSVADDGQTWEGFMEDAGPSPSDVLAAKEEEARIRAAVLQLPDDYRRVIDLRVHQALSYDDVGREMSRTAEAARKLFVRAVDDLRLRMRADDQLANRH
jgi:RNA polymerase sigma-70 factor, ECF subfamily